MGSYRFRVTLCCALLSVSGGLGCQEPRRLETQEVTQLRGGQMSVEGGAQLEAGLMMAGHQAGGASAGSGEAGAELEAGGRAGAVPVAGSLAGSDGGALAGSEAGAEVGGAEVGGAEVGGAEAGGGAEEWTVSASLPPVEVTLKELWGEGSVQHAWPIKAPPPSADRWVIESARGLAVVDGLNLTPLRFGQPLTERPLALSAMRGGERSPQYLLSTASQLWVPSSAETDMSAWELSPLTDDLGGAWAMNLSASGDDMTAPSLWLWGELGLSLWRSDVLTRFGWLPLEGVSELGPSSPAEPRQAQLLTSHPLPPLTEGLEGAESAGLWLWVEGDEPSGRSEVALLHEGQLWRHPSWRSQAPICVSGRGVWGLRDGALWGGVSGEAWSPVHLRSGERTLTVERLWCRALNVSSVDEEPMERLWVLADGALWRLSLSPAGASSAEELRAVALSGDWRGGAINEQGALTLWGSRGLVSLESQRGATWLASEGVTLNERPRDFLLRLDAPDEVLELKWGARESAEESPLFERALDPLNPLVTLTNLDLTEGTLELYAVVTYDGAEPITATLDIYSAPVTSWGEHIAPLHQARCAACHGGTGARDLSDAAKWLTNIDDILLVTREQSMPIGAPPLSEEELDLIERWKLGGGIE